MLDLLLLSVPYTASFHAPAAPAILKSAASKKGYSVSFVDWNIEILHSDPKIEETFRHLCVNNKIIDKNLILEQTNILVDRLIKLNPKYIGISVFTYNCLPITKLVCLLLRVRFPQCKIILGGQGLSNNGINSSYSWGEQAKTLNLCDHWIKSEGEFSLIEILDGKKTIDGNWQQIENLDQLYTPDYDDYNWTLYTKGIPVTASRGCIRRCTFCDIHQHWKKFVFRDGKNVANEMIYQSKKYGISKIRFTDSLLNGSMKAYRNMITHLAEHNNSTKNKIRWTSQFIFRPANQMTDTDWKLTAESGAEDLNIGVESLSEEIRDHMKKKFSNADILYSLNKMQEHGITCTFLMIVGYVTETQKHIDEAKHMLQNIKMYAGTTIKSIEFGSTLGILPGTPLSDMYGEDIIAGTNENNWVNTRTGSTLQKRLQWLQDLKNFAVELGFGVTNDNVHLSILENFSRQDER